MLERNEQVGKRINILSWVGSLFIIASTLIVAVTHDLKTAGTTVFTIVTVTCIAFCALYRRSKWRSTAPGRALMYVVGSFGSVGLVICASLFFGTEYPGRDQVRMATYLGVALALYNVAITVLRYQWETKVELLRQADEDAQKG